MKKFLLIIIPIFIVVVVLILLFFPTKETIDVCFDKICFKAQIARNYISQTAGLMDRDKLAENEGMIFVFPNEKKYAFWMKNTLIPLDIIWINKDKKVVYISSDNQPCLEEKCFSIVPETDAQYVLEINAGLAMKNNIKVGDNVSLEY